MDVSEVVDELDEFAELSSKLSFDVCECGCRAMGPLTLGWDKPYSAARSRCTTPEDCESIAVFVSETKEGISRTPRRGALGAVGNCDSDKQGSGSGAVGGSEHVLLGTESTISGGIGDFAAAWLPTSVRACSVRATVARLAWWMVRCLSCCTWRFRWFPEGFARRAEQAYQSTVGYSLSCYIPMASILVSERQRTIAGVQGRPHLFACLSRGGGN
jgi:hypothetical protein